MSTTLSIGAAALLLGVGVNTLRAWHASGFFVLIYRTKDGHRRYDPSDVARVMKQDAAEKPRVTDAYARVSTHDQKKDLGTQVERLKVECANRGWPNVEVVTDLGSGMNYDKRGLRLLVGRLWTGCSGSARNWSSSCADSSAARSWSSNPWNTIRTRPSPRTYWRYSPCFRRGATA